MMSRAGGDALHNQSEWAMNRTTLKNYIDRRSSEAQQATLDYQNILNRYNNAYEIMSKMQEKIDNLLKGQLRNFG
jgi:transcriptional regulatory protein LevR